MKIWKFRVHLIAQEFFQYSLITYLILLLAETLKEGFVSSFFNFNILLWIVLLRGVCMVVTNPSVELPHTPKKLNGADVQNSIVFAVIGGAIVYIKTEELGSIA